MLGSIMAKNPPEEPRHFDDFTSLRHQILQKINDFTQDDDWRSELENAADNLLQRGEDDSEQIISALGIKTSLSTSEYSARANLINEHKGNFDQQGHILPPLTEGEKKALQEQVLQQYDVAYAYIQNNVTDLLGVGGSFSRGKAHLGIIPLGITYYHAEQQHLSSSLEGTQKPPSDLDLFINLPNIDDKLALEEKIEELCEKVLEEYGVLIQCHFTQPDEDLSFASKNEINQAGGLANWYKKKFVKN